MLPGASPTCVNEGPSGWGEDTFSIGLLGFPPVRTEKLQPEQDGWEQYGLFSKITVTRLGLSLSLYQIISLHQMKNAE